MVVVQDLIDRMRQGDFHKAREEAGRLADLGVLREIQAILEQSTDDAEKLYCYWMLGDMGRNTNSPQVADFLMERVAAEKKAKLRANALQQLAFLAGASNAANAIAALRDKNRDVRRHAIAALGASNDPKGEEALLAILASDENVETTRQATIALARVGALRCVDAMVALFRHLPRDRMREITVAAALLGLARVGGPQALPLAAGELGDSRSAFVNLACMLVIEQHGNESHIDSVVARLRSFINQRTRQDMEYDVPLLRMKFGSELYAGVSFLGKFADPRIEDFLVFLRGNWPRLFERERAFLEANGIKAAEIG